MKTCCLSNSKIRYLRALFILTISMLSMAGCNRKNVESPNNSDQNWGFGSSSESKDNNNTFQSNTAAIADQSTYTYIDDASFLAKVKENMIGEYEGIYRMSYQDAALAQMEEEKRIKQYTIDNPLLIYNPFGTNLSSLYLYLGNQQQKVVVYYTVSAADETIPDFSDTLYINRTASQEIEGQIVGLIPGQQNKLVIDIKNDAGSRIAKKAYLIDVPSNTSNVPTKLSVEIVSEVEYTRGLFHYLTKTLNGEYYVFYDNYGILRGNIPCNIQQVGAKALPAGNQLVIECMDNVFAVLNNLGKVVSIYPYESGGNIIDYDYDNTNNTILMIVQRLDAQSTDLIVALNLNKGEWVVNTDFTKLIPKYKELFVEETTNSNDQNIEASKSKDWMGLQDIQAMEGNDLIVLSKSLNSVIRVNNIYSQPVIRWIIGPEDLWRNTEYESLLLFESGKKTKLQEIDGMTTLSSKKLKEGQFYLNLINRESLAQEQPKSYFYQYVVDEFQNRYRVVKAVTFTERNQESSAIVYGTHVILGMLGEKTILEYNDKGEIMLRIILPNNNSSNQIYKYTMDRYWF